MDDKDIQEEQTKTPSDYMNISCLSLEGIESGYRMIEDMEPAFGVVNLEDMQLRIEALGKVGNP